MACVNGHLDVVKFLSSLKGIDINISDDSGSPPVSSLNWILVEYILAAYCQNDPELLDVLVQNKRLILTAQQRARLLEACVEYNASEALNYCFQKGLLDKSMVTQEILDKCTNKRHLSTLFVLHKYLGEKPPTGNDFLFEGKCILFEKFDEQIMCIIKENYTIPPSHSVWL